MSDDRLLECMGCLLWCRPLAHLLNQNISEGFVEQDVDEEVDDRVEYDEHVGDGQQRAQ